MFDRFDRWQKNREREREKEEMEIPKWKSTWTNIFITFEMD